MSNKEGTKVASCTCEHSFQDKCYGHGKRVFNATAKEEGNVRVYRCTVCLRTKPIAG